MPIFKPTNNSKMKQDAAKLLLEEKEMKQVPSAGASAPMTSNPTYKTQAINQSLAKEKAAAAAGKVQPLFNAPTAPTIKSVPPAPKPTNPNFGGDGSHIFDQFNTENNNVGNMVAMPVAGSIPGAQQLADKIKADREANRTPVPQPPADIGKTAEQILQDLLSGGERNTSEEKDLARQLSAAAEAKALLDSRARSGFGGFGLSGAAAAQEGDVRRQTGQALTQELTGIDRAAREEQLKNVQLGLQTGQAKDQLALEQQRAQIEKDAWQLAIQQMEKELQTDLNKDGIIAGKTEADKEKQKQEEADARAVSQAYAGEELTPERRKDLESQGLRFHRADNPPWFLGFKDQFGNEYPSGYDDSAY